MATVFTHALVGAALATPAPSGASQARLALAAAALAVLPDLDVVTFSLGIPYGSPLGHRGLTHSLPFALVLGPLTALALFPAPPRLSSAWWRLAAILSLATASHGLLDAFTDAGRGVGFWIPFSDARSFFPWRPLVAPPIGISTFWNGTARATLAREILWVWLPVLAWVVAVRLARRRSWVSA